MTVTRRNKPVTSLLEEILRLTVSLRPQLIIIMEFFPRRKQPQIRDSDSDMSAITSNLEFSPTTVISSLSPDDSTTRKVITVIKDARYDSPSRDANPPNLMKPSPNGSINSITSNASSSSTGSLFKSLLTFSLNERPSTANVPKLGEKRKEETSTFSLETIDKRSKVTTKKNPTYGSPSCGSKEPLPLPILKGLDGHGKDEQFDPRDVRAPKSLRI